MKKGEKISALVSLQDVGRQSKVFFSHATEINLRKKQMCKLFDVKQPVLWHFVPTS